MLFRSKKAFSVTEKQIKEELCDENGICVLRINLRYPELRCGKKDPLAHNARDFYPRVAEGFLHGARSELLTAAKAASKGEGFLPYSATMRWEKTFESEKYISFLLDFAVSDGVTQTVERKTQVWERKFGTKCPLTVFVDKSQRKDFCEQNGIDKKALDISLFALRENGIELFYRVGEVLMSRIFEHEGVKNA